MVHFSPTGLNEKYKNCCMHYLTYSNDALNKMHWCYQGTYKAIHHDFAFDNQEYFRCNECFKQKNVTLSIIETLNNESVLADYQKFIKKFNSKLDKLKYLAYNICNEIEFDIGMKKIDNINEYKQCQLEKDKFKKQISAQSIWSFILYC